MHIFTSISSNYIPKARVLARSVKKNVPHATFHLLLCDTPPVDFDLDREDFDNLILLDDLHIPDKQAWIFQHNVVELCTAVKGIGFREIFRKFGADKIIFFDPDMVLFSDIALIEQRLEQHCALLTPHQTEPETSRSAILDNEVGSLKHGVFNLGFLAVRNSPEGLRFIEWWSSRLLQFCFDDKRRGLFTDQKWVDLAPAFFPELGILREPQFNVSTWNLSHRDITGDLENGIFVNQSPLCFYHFSGIDSGAQKIMLDLYGQSNPLLGQLRQWYLQQCELMGQKQLGQLPCVYGSYANGDVIRPAERLLYRYREQLPDQFPDPYASPASGQSYQAWYRDNAPDSQADTPELETISLLQHELDTIHHSISWRIARKLAQIYRGLDIRLGLHRFIK